MTKKNEKVVIFYAEALRRKELEKLGDAIKRTYEASQLFEEITGEPVTLLNYEAFMKNPAGLAEKIFKSKIIIPQGFNPEKYLEMLQYPDFQRLAHMLTHEYCSPVFVKWNEGAKPEWTDKAVEIVERHDIVLEAGSIKLKAWETFKVYVDSVNLLHDLTGSFHDFVNVGNLNAMADPVYCEQGSKIVGYKANPVKFIGKFSNL